MAIQDAGKGLVIHSGPVTLLEIEASATVYEGMPVKLSAGLCEEAPEDTEIIAGVAQNYGVDGDTILVSVNPDTIYSGTGNSAAVVGDIGYFVSFVDAGLYSGTKSEAIVDTTGANAAVTSMYMKIVGISDNVTNAATNLGVRVKLVKTQFDNEVTQA